MKKATVFLSLALACAALAVPAEVKRGKLRRGPEEFKLGRPAGVVFASEGLRLEPGAAVPGLFTSPVLSMEFQASALYFLWKAELPEGSEMLVEVRYRSRDGKWSEWLGLEGLPTEDYPETRPELRGYYFSPDPHLVMDGVDFFQYRVHLMAAPGHKGPLFRELLVNYADLRPLLKQLEDGRKAAKR